MEESLKRERFKGAQINTPLPALIPQDKFTDTVGILFTLNTSDRLLNY